MSAIIFSMESGSEDSAKEAIEFLETHDTIAWGSNIPIADDKYRVSPSNPLIGYINYESKVRYRVRIIEIICNKIAKPYPNKEERPEEWDDGMWRTFFRFNEFEEIDPIDTTSFKKTNGQFVKHPPQNYVEVVD